MLTKTQVREIKKHLDRAQNPVFFFDNDQDGLCSFLLLQRFIGRGRGIPIKSFPELIPEYFRRVLELNADYIFILDKPIVSEGFFNKAKEYNIPVVWIDHHEPDAYGFKVPKDVSYFNPILNRKKSSEPVTALCYQVTGKKEDAWIGVAGCIADNYVPEFYSGFKKEYPELIPNKKEDAFDIYYKSDIGKVSRILGFGLKDRTTNVVNMIRFLIKAKSPHDVLHENSKNYTLHKRFKELDAKYHALLKKATEAGKAGKAKILFFKYAGDLSISADIASELYYIFSEKIIVVVYVKGLKANISMRGKGVKNIILEAVRGLENARGGGHDEAVGGQIRVDDIGKFKERLQEITKHSN